MVTVLELKAQINSLLAQLQSLEKDKGGGESSISDDNDNRDIIKILKWGIEEIRYEISRIENFLSDLSSRGSALITASGLISLLPFFQNANDFFRYYITYIFPFLAIGIFAYIFAQRRSYTYRIYFTFPNSQPSYELEVIQDYQRATEDVWDSVHKSYERSLVWHRISAIGIFCFLISYILNFYFYFFSILPTPKLAFIQMILFVILGVLEYYRKSRLQSFSKDYKKSLTQRFTEGGVGAAPPDIFNK